MAYQKKYQSKSTIFVSLPLILIQIITGIASREKKTIDDVIEEAIDVYLKTD